MAKIVNKRGKSKKAKKVINIVIGIVAFIIICLIANNYIAFDKNKTINLVINNKNVTSNLKNQVLIENNTMAPTIGTKAIQYHQPERPISCIRRTNTEMLGIRIIRP